MPKLLVNQTMSRNGGTLICQLLEGHPQVFFLPFHFDLATTVPRCWPLSGFSAIRVEDFCRTLVSKCSVWRGDYWHTAQNSALADDPRVDIASLPFERLNKSAPEGIVDYRNLASALTSALADLAAGYGSAHVEALEAAEYLVIDADHSFNCGMNGLLYGMPDAIFVQVIRNVLDVVASRKNMLLHHRRIFGDPRDHSLKATVIQSETSRWIWSILVAARSGREAPDNTISIQFESLHLHRQEVMRQVADRLAIDDRESLTVEGLGDLTFDGRRNSQFLPSSSLNRVTLGERSTVIDTWEYTLNEGEVEVLFATLGLRQPFWPQVPDLSAFRKFISDICDSKWDVWRRNPRLVSLMAAAEGTNVMSVYSKMNFGRINAEFAFE